MIKKKCGDKLKQTKSRKTEDYLVQNGCSERREMVYLEPDWLDWDIHRYQVWITKIISHQLKQTLHFDVFW